MRKRKTQTKLTPEDSYRRIFVNGEKKILYPCLMVKGNSKIMVGKIGSKDGEIFCVDNKPIPYKLAGFVDVKTLHEKMAE